MFFFFTFLTEFKSQQSFDIRVFFLFNYYKLHKISVRIVFFQYITIQNNKTKIVSFYHNNFTLPLLLFWILALQFDWWQKKIVSIPLSLPYIHIWLWANRMTKSNWTLIQYWLDKILNWNVKKKRKMRFKSTSYIESNQVWSDKWRWWLKTNPR